MKPELGTGQAMLVDQDEVRLLLARATLHEEVESGMTGPIRVLELKSYPGERWILEQDLKRRPVLRRLHPADDPARFIESRLADYERMWDG